MGWVYIFLCSISIIYNLSAVVLESLYEMKDNYKAKNLKKEEDKKIKVK